jgi:hypothetical protein
MTEIRWERGEAAVRQLADGRSASALGAVHGGPRDVTDDRDV